MSKLPHKLSPPLRLWKSPTRNPCRLQSILKYLFNRLKNLKPQILLLHQLFSKSLRLPLLRPINLLWSTPRWLSQLPKSMVNMSRPILPLKSN